MKNLLSIGIFIWMLLVTLLPIYMFKQQADINRLIVEYIQKDGESDRLQMEFNNRVIDLFEKYGTHNN